MVNSLTKIYCYTNYSECISNTLLMICFFLMSFRSTISSSFVNAGGLLPSIQVFIIISLLLCIILNNYTKRQFIVSLCFFFISFNIFLVNKSLIPFFIFLSIIASNNKYTEKFILSFLLGTIFSVLIVLSFYALELIPTRTMFDHGILVNSLGFKNPNVLGFKISIIVFYWLYLRYENISIMEFYLLLIISIYFGVILYARTTLYLNCLMIVFCFLCKFSNYISYLFKKYVIQFSFFIILFGVLGCVFVNILPIVTVADKLLSGRFQWGQKYLLVYGIHFWGIQAKNKATENLPLDDGFAYLLVIQGIIFFCVYFIIIIKTMLRAKKDNNIRLIFLLFCTLLGMLTEGHYIPVIENCVIILSQKYLYKKFEKKNEKNHSIITNA